MGFVARRAGPADWIRAGVLIMDTGLGLGLAPCVLEAGCAKELVIARAGTGLIDAFGVLSTRLCGDGMVEALDFGKAELTVRLAGVLGNTLFSDLLIGDRGRTKPLSRPIVELSFAGPTEEDGREEGRIAVTGP